MAFLVRRVDDLDPPAALLGTHKIPIGQGNVLFDATLAQLAAFLGSGDGIVIDETGWIPPGTIQGAFDLIGLGFPAPVNAFGEIGTADDSPAFQAAFDYIHEVKGSGRVSVPAGVFKVQDVSFYPGVYCEGDGAGGTTINVPTVYDPDLPIFKADPDGASIFQSGGFANMSIIGPGTGVATVPGHGDEAVPIHNVNGIDFSALDPLGVGYRLYDWKAIGLTIGQCLIGLNLYKNLYSVVLQNIFAYNNMIGLYADLQHPNLINCDLRYNDIAYFPRVTIDWTCTQIRFSLGRIGVTGTFPAWHARAGENDGGVQRSTLIGCTFWQNQQLGIELGTQNKVLGSLFKGPKGLFPAPIADNNWIKIKGRQNLVSDNLLFGDNDGYGIDLAATDVAVQPLNEISNNMIYINNGVGIGKSDAGSMPQTRIVDNRILVAGYAIDPETDEVESTLQLGIGKGLIVHVPTGAGLVQNLEIARNQIRVDGTGVGGGLVIPTALVTILDTGTAGIGPELQLDHNTSRLTGGVDAKLYNFASYRNSVFENNPFRLGTGSNVYSSKAVFSAEVRGAIVKDNSGLPLTLNLIGYAKSAVRVASTSATETALATITIPAGAMGPNGELAGDVHYSYTNNANAKNIKVRLGGLSGTIFFQTAPTTTGQNHFIFRIQNRNSEAAQVGNAGMATGGLGGATGTPPTGTVDTTVEQTLVITGQTNGTDEIALERFSVELTPN